jgi:RNA polymerase sigma-70 factor (ECF subfamily)
VILRDVQQLTTEEAAEIVGVSLPAFKARLHRGRVQLREQLNSYVSSLKK